MRSALMRVIPACFVTGAAMELFMLNTGFYDIVTRKEGERVAERLEEEERMRNRMKELGVRFEK